MIEETRHDLWNLLLQLQAKTRRQYGWSEMARTMGISDVQCKKIFMNEQSENSSLTNKTLTGVRRFFAAEGMPIDYNDIYGHKPKDTPANDDPNPP